jgi:small-conductance mechanosensitive channel
MKLKDLLKETTLWTNRKFGDRLPTVADYKDAYNKKNGINEATDVAQELESTLMDAHIGLGNAQRNLLIELTRQKHGDAETVPNASVANKQIQKVKQEFKKLCKLVKVTSFKP